MRTFDAKSLLLLAVTDTRLAGVMKMAIGRTPFAWRIVQSARTIEQQRTYYRARRSLVNPDKYATPALLYAKAKHIIGPGMELSRAVDVCIVGTDPYNVAFLRALAAVVKECAKEAGVVVRWGGDFKKIADMPHFEVD